MYHRVFRAVVLGVEHYTVPPLEAAIQETTEAGMSLLVAPVIQGYIPPQSNRVANGFMTDAFGITNCEVGLRFDSWSRYVVAKIDVDLDNQQQNTIDRNKCLALIFYMKQLGVHAVMLSLRNTDNADLAMVLRAVAHSVNPIQIWVRVTMERQRKNANNLKPRKGRFYNQAHNSQLEKIEKECGSIHLPNPWDSWSNLHENANFSHHVRVVLELPVMVPDGETVKRWLAEPIVAVVVPAHLFYERHGSPVLTYPHQRVLIELVRNTNALVIIGGRTRHPLLTYTSYIQLLWSRRQMPLIEWLFSPAEGWVNEVQLPLQPLQEDFELRSYTLLERDAVKYELYARAIMEALQRKKSHKELDCTIKAPCYVDEEDQNLMPINLYVGSNFNKVFKNEDQRGLIRVAVLGAGRGTLVSIVLNAATTLGARVKVYAIEKNDSACFALDTRKEYDWMGHDVEILKEDFRLSSITPKCDIAVSELLGSWGDNGLAPECLDAASKILRIDCEYIPFRYTSYVVPTSSSKVWAAAKAGGNSMFFGNNDRHLETIWVSYMKNKMDLGEPKAVFSFEHPTDPLVENGEPVLEGNEIPKVNRSRSTTLTWTVNRDSVMHGFAGYFHCNLLDKSELSFNTLPRTYTEGLISWFPVFIPLKTPMRLSKGCEVKAVFWRCTAVDRVWYEWIAESGDNSSGIHNANGASYVMYSSL